MQNYLTAGEGYEMKCSEQELISNLIEMYTYYFKEANQLHEKFFDERVEEAETKDEEDINAYEINSYRLGKADGAVETLSEILLSVLGGGNMYDIWHKTMMWVNKSYI